MNEPVTYKSLLKNTRPVETGDFMHIYQFDKGHFILYSPQKGKVSCIELMNFTEISPYELGLFLEVDVESLLQEEEFVFDVVTDKESVLAYIFDINHLDDFRYRNEVQPFHGFVLKESDRIRNLAEIETSSFKFDNVICSIDNGNASADELLITFDPGKYDRVVNSDLNSEYYIHLFPAAYSYLLEKLSKDKKLNLLIGKENPLEILKTFIFFLNRAESGSILLDTSNSFLSLGLKKEFFPTEDIVNMSTRAIKQIRATHGSSVKTVYTLKNTEEWCFIMFRNAADIIYSLNEAIYEKFKPAVKLIH
ncbi:MAG: hypothetical protein LBG80_04540 [Bacteroidales bacterium]|jgi:hypothetical protein|nr:hypothetical protein [Bacteroidales bacterium]